MSVNRRLYQWLLNRVGDSAAIGLSVVGVEEQIDTTFFTTFALPIAKKAIEEYLKLDTVEVTSGLASWDGTREHQTQYTEVRVCRLLLYFMDRPELGSLILEETLLMLIEAACKNDTRLERVLVEEEEKLGMTKKLSLIGTSAAAAAGSINCDQSRRLSVTSKSSLSSRQSWWSCLSVAEENSPEQVPHEILYFFVALINLL
ncbi:unnamed protein product [Gongylonema pulchrum]|uniref:Phosphorylase b kinase regulatory subunit n=1 Tax=Gongylonema pulchrum TaxID=637853 RepID=A0A183D7K4_9BILA|nr:unnamed protein product [Gongylonema pulchrum]